MSHILSIYSTKAYKAYLLPVINNSDHSIIINKDIFCLDRDIELNLEIIDNSWHFLASDNYKVEENSTKRDYAGVNLTSGTILSILLPGGEPLSVMYDVTDISFSVFEKFELAGMSYITIGKNENCDIRYDNRNLISREHAIIRNQGTQWIIEDHSANGVFVNARRVVGSRQLMFGDSISFFGLTIVFLGDIGDIECVKKIMQKLILIYKTTIQFLQKQLISQLQTKVWKVCLKSEHKNTRQR